MSGGGKGGGQTTTAEIPEWAKEPTIRNLQRAEDVQQIGYMPYMGPDLAAFNQTQMGAMQNQLDAASAFGLSAPSTPMQGMPQAQDFGGGMMGYSAYPIFEQAQREFAARNPLQQQAYDDLFVEPTTNNFAPLTPEESYFAPPSASTGPIAAPLPAEGGLLPNTDAAAEYKQKMDNRKIDELVRSVDGNYSALGISPTTSGAIKKGHKSVSGQVKKSDEQLKKEMNDLMSKELVKPKRSDFVPKNVHRGRQSQKKIDREYKRALARYEKQLETQRKLGVTFEPKPEAKPEPRVKQTSEFVPSPVSSVNKSREEFERSRPSQKRPRKKSYEEIFGVPAPDRSAFDAKKAEEAKKKKAPAKKRQTFDEAMAEIERKKKQRAAAKKKTRAEGLAELGRKQRAAANKPKTVESAVADIVRPEEPKTRRQPSKRSKNYRGRSRRPVKMTRSSRGRGRG